jgi:glycosyltransferase involved in cell wall biosynthesis
MALFLHTIDGRAVSNLVSSLAEEMLDLGVEVTVMTTEIRDGDGWSSRVRTVDLGGRGRRTTWCIPSLERSLVDLRPDVLVAHTNGPNRAAVLACAALPRRSRPMTIAVEHVQYSSTDRSLPRVRRLANALLLPRADRVVGVSPGVATDLGKLFPRTRPRLAMIPPPVMRLTRIRSLASEPVDDPWFSDAGPTLVTVGNINRYKDQETLIRALARVERTPARLAVIGRPDDPALLRRLRDLTAQLGVHDRVRFLGYQANPLKFVARSSAFVLSSRSEGLPVAILEALACRVPVVSTACAGPAWLLQEGRTGLLAPVGDDRALAAALETVLTDGRERRRIVDAGSVRVRAFEPRKIARQYLRLAGVDR